MSDNNMMSGTRNESAFRNNTVARYFSDWPSASRAVDALHNAGFHDDQIGILARDPRNSDTSATTREGKAVDNTENVAGKALSGAAIGGAAGLLAALAALIIPGVGPIVAGGVFATMLGSTAAGAGIGAAAGGVIGVLTDMGMSVDDARYYDEGIRGGGTLVTVHDSDRATEAARILEQNGGRQRS